ncbi:hypothetical protein H072_810 [Dactylellina haptotyla CBS 200.50]|uniref:CENP-C homolog n=1 Tax=Dactylellina haptotyla (strain CBS 200.50) TaxID=1284197 RepID=S8AQG4_DACHA|nr:hypothetical protein H072_810 [Dactylellina haptotyla CBS 200.50]
MASTTHRKRENMHTDIGMVGRKTGFTLANLPRNDDGMENMSAFFSSPRAESEVPPQSDFVEGSILSDNYENEHEIVETSAASPVHERPTGNHGFLSDSASMDIVESSAGSLSGILESRNYPGIRSPAKRKSMASSAASRAMVVSQRHNAPTTLVTSPSSPPILRQIERRSSVISTTASPKRPLNTPTENALLYRKQSTHTAPISTRITPPKPGSATVKNSIGLGPSVRSLARGNGRLVAHSLKQTRPISKNMGQKPDVYDYDQSSETDNSEGNAIPLSERDSNADIVGQEDPLPRKQTGLRKQTRRDENSIMKSVDANINVVAKPGLVVEDDSNLRRGRRKQESRVAESANINTEPFQPLEMSHSEAETSNIPPLSNNSAIVPKQIRLLGPIKGSGSRIMDSENENGTSGGIPQGTEHEPGEKRRAGRPKKNAHPASQFSSLNTSRSKRGAATKNLKGEGGVIIEPTSIKRVDAIIRSSVEIPDISFKRGEKRKLEPILPNTETPVIGAVISSKKHVGGLAEPGIREEKKRRKAEPASIEPDLASANEKITRHLEVDRPKRSRIAPLQFWKNERRIYQVNERRESGTAISLNEQIIRVEDTPIIKPKRRSRARSPPGKVPKRAGKNRRDNSSSDENSQSEADEEDWEKAGKLVGMVRQWATGNNDGETGEVEDEIATSHHGIEFKPIFGSDYLFAKTLGKEFMGCGILELQTGASKKLKSSGKMQLVFFMLQGKVEVEINELGFRISRGGQFQVPRGNMYKISNPFERTAKIFFAQACIPETEVD